jgi:TetR/AcrR family transcriptional regulator, cholesterol catabolism regulator
VADGSRDAKAPARGSSSPAAAPGTRKAGRKYERRREEIVDMAAKVFAERGFHATTIDDLVKATGLQRGGLYHYIDSKLDLLIAIHERFIEPLLAEASEIQRQGLPADVELRELAHALMHAIATYRDQVTVFLHEWRIIESEPAWSNVRTARKEFEQIITDTLERGRQDGIFDFADLRLSVLAFLGMINYSYQWYDAQGRMPADRVADYFFEIYYGGLRAPNGSRNRARNGQTRAAARPKRGQAKG